MKTFLIVAGMLMAGASVYGVVDYNKKIKTQEFKELYKEKPAPVETEVVEEKTVTPVAEKNENTKVQATANTEKAPVKKVVKKKHVIKPQEEKRVFHFKEFSRGRIG